MATDDVDFLRRAAARMRELAEAAGTDERWRVDDSDFWLRVPQLQPIGQPTMRHHADHIAAWDPAVASTVADWLDTAGADLWAHGPLHCPDGCDECDDDLWMPHVRRALALARTFVREDQPAANRPAGGA